jgi:hypothetical protein
LLFTPGMNRHTCAAAAVVVTLTGCTQPSAPAVVHEDPLPPPVDAGRPTGTGTSVLALRDVSFGDKDDAGNPSSTAWESLGFDIDGLVTTYASNDVCRLAAGASRDAQIDGVAGIDNSFGANVLPILLTVLASDATSVFDYSLDNGQASSLIAVDDLGPEANAIPLATRFLVGAPRTTTPMWNGSDVFPIDSISFDDAGAPALAFTQSYVNGGTFVAAPPSGLGTIWIGTKDGIAYKLAITHMQLEMRIASDASGATGGILSGILPTDALVEVARSASERISMALCSAAAFASIATQFEQASDILVDGTQDPTKSCDGVSIGLGFSASRVQLGPTTTVPPAADPCVDP